MTVPYFFKEAEGCLRDRISGGGTGFSDVVRRILATRKTVGINVKFHLISLT